MKKYLKFDKQSTFSIDLIMKISFLLICGILMGSMVDNLAGKYLLVDVNEAPENKIGGIFNYHHRNSLLYTLKIV